MVSYQHWTYGDSALAPWKHEHILELESLGVNFDGSVNDTYLKAPSHNKEELWQNVDGCEVGWRLLPGSQVPWKSCFGHLELGTQILAFVNLVFAGGIKGSAHWSEGDEVPINGFQVFWGLWYLFAVISETLVSPITTIWKKRMDLTKFWLVQKWMEAQEM